VKAGPESLKCLQGIPPSDLDDSAAYRLGESLHPFFLCEFCFMLAVLSNELRIAVCTLRIHKSTVQPLRNLFGP
jgi:hypothetical protein